MRKDINVKEVIDKEMQRYGMFSKNIEATEGEWLRISMSRKPYMSSGMLIHLGNNYRHHYPSGQLISILFSGYADLKVKELNISGSRIIDKVRIFKNKEKDIYLDIHFCSKKVNIILLNIFNAFNVEQVADNTIKELPGYEFQEVSL